MLHNHIPGPMIKEQLSWPRQFSSAMLESSVQPSCWMRAHERVWVTVSRCGALPIVLYIPFFLTFILPAFLIQPFYLPSDLSFSHIIRSATSSATVFCKPIILEDIPGQVKSIVITLLSTTCFITLRDVCPFVGHCLRLSPTWPDAHVSWNRYIDKVNNNAEKHLQWILKALNLDASLTEH